jgi:photosystem II stability/assembly factor-like uncharacterized protein
MSPKPIHRHPLLPIALLLALFACSAATAELSREPEPVSRRMSKAEEARRFHLFPARGTDVATRMRGYEQRQRMKEASPFGRLLWRNVGPEVQGGRVIDIRIPADRTEQVYVAFATGGLWRTEDEGITWTSLFDDQSAFGIGAIAVSRRGRTIWVGTGEANSQRTSYAGTGMFKSVDGGKTWRHLGLAATHYIGRVLIDPKDEDTVWVAAMGHLYTPNPERGVYKTTDGGRTWQHVLKTDDYTGAIDLAIDPRDPRVAYAAMWDRERRAWNFRESGPGSALYQTRDGGATWRKLSELPHGEAAGRYGLALCRARPDTVYAFLDNQSNDPDWEFLDEFAPSGRLTPRRFLLLDEQRLLQVERPVLEAFFRQYAPRELNLDETLRLVREGKLTVRDVRKKIEERSPDVFSPDLVAEELYRTDDGGRTWRRVENGRFGEHGGYYWGKVSVNPRDPNDVYTLGVLLLHSKDGGRSWERTADEAHVDFHSVCFDPRGTRKVWIGCDGGVYLSPDGGEHLRHLNNLSVGQATTLAVDMKRPYNIYVGLQDNGTLKGPSAARTGRGDLGRWERVFGGDGSAVTVDPRDGGDLVYTAMQFGVHMARNQKTGETWSARAQAPPGDPPIRYNWISPLILSPHNPDLVYLGAQRLYRSTNQGKKYEPISPDLTKNRPNGDVPFSTIKDISESPLRVGLIYVGCDDGNVQMTADGGGEWIDISTPAPSKWVSRVVASKWDEGTVYVAQNGYREDDSTAYLWKSTDQGHTWTSIMGNLPPEPINVIREDPTHRGMLFVGTDMGVYVSFDDGGSWETLHGGLPNTPVHDLLVQARDNDLVIATHSRGAWVLPLRTVYLLTPELRKTDLALLPVESMRRQPNWGYERRQPWEREPATAAVLRATFFSRNPGSATVRIRDRDGSVIKEKTVAGGRGFNPVEIDLLLAPGRPGTVDVRNRELRTAEDALKDPREAERARYLEAGDYTVDVTVSGRTTSQPWKLTR